jgi:hypothetical protein
MTAGSLTQVLRVAGMALAGVACGLTLGLQPALSSNRFDPGFAVREDHDTLNAEISIDALEERHLRFAQAQDLAFSVSDIVSQPNRPIPLPIKLREGGAEDYRFFKIVGLPEGFELSSGFPTKNAWLVAVKNIEGLQIVPPAEFVGEVELQILLFKGKDDPPQVRTVTLSIGQKAAGVDTALTSAVEPASPSLDSDAQADRPTLTTVPKRVITQQQENTGMRRADRFLKNLDIAAARLIYESMARKGSGRAAFAMGQTYDPSFLRNYVVEGLQPDIEQAMKWYKLAIELGNSEAEARLAALNSQ